MPSAASGAPGGQALEMVMEMIKSEKRRVRAMLSVVHTLKGDKAQLALLDVLQVRYNLADCCVCRVHLCGVILDALVGCDCWMHWCRPGQKKH